MNDDQVAHLLQLYFNGSITPLQQETLADWIQDNGHTEQFENLMQQSWRQFQPGDTVADEKAAQWLQQIMANTTAVQPAPVITGSRAWVRWAAAAAILIVFGLGILFLLIKNKKPAQEAMKTIVKQDVPPPATSTAVLTLANGQRIVLDSAAKGSLAMQGNTEVVKLEDGKIAYKGADAATAMQYNTLTVPAGSRITGITLADGTSVTLNAASSITYPVAFNNRERKVKITGEVFFEVNKDRIPFIVDIDGKAAVEVLGTSFNVKAYEEEGNIKTTLIEGKLKVANQMLKPGEQAVLSPGSRLTINGNTDLAAVMAWKNGLFLYKDADLKTIMREVARAYNVTVNYESVSNEKFYAEVSRNTNISNLLQMLELTGEVHFKIQGNQVTVLK